MTVAYPIIARRKLEQAEKAGWFRKQSRTNGELLKPDAHHVLVYRVGGEYLLDGDKLRSTDERVVNATHVSMVDMRREAPVVVVLTIPSADASHFEVVVTFTCTVTDPVAVVRGGVDAREALWGHLKTHHRIFELGLDYRLSQVNEVRRAVSAQVNAYVTIKPPVVRGMDVLLASVEVTNPEFLAKYEEENRQKDVEQRLAQQELAYQQRIKAGQVLHDHSLQSVQQDHEHRMADKVHNRDQVVETSTARHRRLLAEEQADFERDQFDRNMQTIGDDPRRALMAAFVSGRIDASTLSEQLRTLDDRDREAQLKKLDRERDERRELLAADREDRRWDREEVRRIDEQKRGEQRRLADQEREDRLRREEQEREDRLRQEKNELDAERERLRMRFELLKQAAEKGHFDMVNLHADRLYAEVMGLAPTAVEAVTSPSLAAVAAPVDKPDIDDPVPALMSDEDTAAQVHEDD